MALGTRSIRIIGFGLTNLPAFAAPSAPLWRRGPPTRSARVPSNKRGRQTISRPSVAIPLALLIALLPFGRIFAQTGYQTEDAYGKSNPFVESMQLMMDAMRSAARTDQGGSWGNVVPDWSQYAPSGGWPGFGGSGYTPPWNSGQLPGQQQMQQMMQGMGAPQGLPFTGTSLDGIWQGRSGDVLVMWGNRFRIYADTDRFTEGQLRVQGNQLWLHNPTSNTTQRYEYALYQGRLALRDAYGQLLLYRRADTHR